VVCDLVVARHGAWAFALSLAIVLPLTILFARAFAAVFESAFRRPRGWSPQVVPA